MDKLHGLERLRDHANRDESATSSDVEPSVGKQTLTEQLAPSASGDREAAPVQMRSMWSQIPFGGGPVQMRATEKETAANDITHGAAQHGISGSGGPLPFLDAIQRAFGHHDVSHVLAHTDGNAAQGARAMGAEAFASGNHVAFAGTPSLHTAAHEAAHVVQQRAGVHLKGGVGEAGDSYEQHADAVADRVVQGKSAVDLLDQVAKPGAAAAAPSTVQHKLGGATAGLTADTLFNAIKGYGVKYSERAAMLTKLKDAPQVFPTIDDAVLFLLQGTANYDKAKQTIEQKAKVKAADDAQKTLDAMMGAKYPSASKDPGGSKKLYRGDGRTPQELRLGDTAVDKDGKPVGGFQAKNPMSLDAAKAQVRAWYRAGADPKAKHEGWIRSLEGGDKIATGTDIGCMGYGVRDAMQGASQNVYMIDVANLTEVTKLTADILGEEPLLPVKYSISPRLLLNAATVEAATMIAVRGVGNAGGETTFFTEIPKSCIKPVFEATKFKEGAAVTGNRSTDTANREKSDRGWVDDEMHAAHEEAARLREAAKM